MAYLKSDSTPIRREAKRRAACRAIHKQVINKLENNNKSYVITSNNILNINTELGYFKNKEFGRG